MARVIRQGIAGSSSEVGQLEERAEGQAGVQEGERMTEVEMLSWSKDECYSLSWQGLITPESFAHPAKMARGQLFRLIRWLFETGRVKKGSVLLDPFGGVSTTAIAGASAGLKVVTCELEEKFYRLGAGYDCPGMTKQEWVRYYGRWSRVKKFCDHCQKGPEVETRGVVPEVAPHRFVGNVDLHRRVWKAAGDWQPVCLLGDSRRLAEVVGPVLAQCCVSSPPYSSEIGMQEKSPTIGTPPRPGDVRQYKRKAPIREYGTSPGQLGAMPPGNLPPGDALASGVVSSPPYESSMESGDKKAHIDFSKCSDGRKVPKLTAGWQGQRSESYGLSEGQMGLTSGETFWSAAKQIVSQCHLLLKPGATTCWVVKSYVKAGKIVPFPDQWAALLEATGFRVTHRIRCHLISETREADLFGGETVKRKERKSFFRRLHEKKSPHTRIDFEEIVVAVKVGEGGSAGAIVSSPPYAESNQDYKAGWKFIDTDKGGRDRSSIGKQEIATYGHTAGQLGGMKPGDAPAPRRCNQCGKGDDGCQCCFLEE